MCAPRIVGHCRGFAWRRLPVSIRCSAARRRPQYEIIITRKVTQWKDVSHAAIVVDEDKTIEAEDKIKNSRWCQCVQREDRIG